MRVVLAGTPAPAVPALQALLASSHEVVGVLTRPDARAGRGRRAVVSPVKELALEAGLPVLAPARPGDDDALRDLVALAPDCVPVVAYGALVPRRALDVPRHGWVNLHFSLLPRWRGAAPVQHALVAGDVRTGATVFRLEEGLDTGPVLGTLEEEVGPRDTSGDLLGRLATSGARLLVDVLDALGAGTATAVAQPEEGVTTAPKLRPDDARVRWEDGAAAVDRRVRGCTPAPGAWTTWRGERLRLGPVEPVGAGEGSPERIPGPGEPSVTRGGVLVGTGDGVVRLGWVQPAGRRAVDAADWARGARPAPGEVLGDGTAGDAGTSSTGGTAAGTQGGMA
ncbi:methionyl-tRNA formyltransferase [Pseudokineococcus lusitanus]|uniref:Methionyl-tRNA formyltransferase n=1 Tax=Pseudokineococcus lusitanus TaxID=763993 RepID=A0A3N1G968_9ACTN|nr:methionyl-tRNA formyltransferase [Pseudokineococcus lusitanus]ROP26799.1 methionyl-tRNA formyltransferase [Pseudokineococcus lusitanus]